MKKENRIIPLEVINYLSQMHKFYKEECIVKEDWKIADEIYHLLLKSYHIYSGLKKDYRRK